MENREGTLIGIGALTLTCLCHFYKLYRQERLEFKGRKHIIEEKCKQIIENGNRIDFQDIKRSGQKELVFFSGVDNYKIQPDTYKKFIRSRRIIDYVNREDTEMCEGQSGGRFSFKDKKSNQEVTVSINNCNIEEQVLQEKREQNIVFEENKNKLSQTNSLIYTIKAGQKLALFGAIGYSFTEQKFILEPEFIVVSRINPENVVMKFSDFLQKKIEKNVLYKMLLAFSILTVGYTLVYLPIKSIWNRHCLKFGEVSKEKMSHFKDKIEFQARVDSNLLCQKCHTENVNIIYDCGHLCLCEVCHSKNKDFKCPVCNKKSSKSIKIFL